MKLKASEIAKIVGGTVVGDAATAVTGLAPIDDARPGDATFILHPKYEKFAGTTGAGVIISGKPCDAAGKTVIVVEKPHEAMVALLEILAAGRARKKTGVSASARVSKTAVVGKDVCIEPFAVVADGASVGDGSTVSAFCYVGENASVGKGCFLHPSVTVYAGCVLGDRVIVHAGTTIGSDGFGYIPSPAGIRKIPQMGIVRVGNDVEIGANTSIDRATMGATVIGDGTKIDNLVHIAHNVKIGRNCLLSGQVGFAGSVIVGDGVMMAGQAGINGHIEIGAGAVIAGQAGVIGNVGSGETVSGYPARPHAKMMRIYALMEKLPELVERIKRLEKK